LDSKTKKKRGGRIVAWTSSSGWLGHLAALGGGKGPDNAWRAYRPKNWNLDREEQE